MIVYAYVLLLEDKFHTAQYLFVHFKSKLLEEGRHQKHSSGKDSMDPDFDFNFFFFF